WHVCECSDPRCAGRSLITVLVRPRLFRVLRQIRGSSGDVPSRPMGESSGECPLRARTPQAAHLRVPARHRESTHDSLAAPPVTVRAAHGRCTGHSSSLPPQVSRSEPRRRQRIRGAVVVSGWLVRGGLLHRTLKCLPFSVGRASDSPRAIPTLRVGLLAAGSRRYSWVESPPRAGTRSTTCLRPSAGGAVAHHVKVWRTTGVRRCRATLIATISA